MGLIVEKIQMNEFDFLAFFIDLIYIVAAIISSIRFSYYFTNFRFDKLIKNEREDLGLVLIFSYIFFVILISSNILHYALHESFFNCLLSIISYTLLVIAVMFSRKPIGFINISPDFMLAQHLNGSKASQIYDSVGFICSAVTISAILYYFYELSLSSIFLLCIATECLLEIIVKLLLLIHTTTLKKAINSNDLQVINIANIMKLHVSLLLMGSACLIDISEDNGLLILITWLFATLILLVITVGISILLDQLLFKKIQQLCDKNVDNTTALSKLLLFLGIDFAIVILLN